MEVLKGMGKLFCSRERKLALECWSSLWGGEITDLASMRFDSDTAEVYFNTGSGYVFLTDEDLNTVMISDDKLDLFISTPYDGKEGFFDELMEEFDDMHQEDKEYMRDIATEELLNKYKEEFKTVAEQD